MNDNSSIPAIDSLIPNLSVRLSVADQPIGSGFVVLSSDQQWVYILTARHCFEHQSNLETVTVEWYDYQRLVFIPLAVSLAECPLLMLDKEQMENSFDGAILVIPVNKLPVPASPISLTSSIVAEQVCHFVGFPDALLGKEPERLKGGVGMLFADSFRVNVQDKVEDNQSTAYANVKGLSGSGLFFQQRGQLYLAGIITDFQASFNRFVAQKLTRYNSLLNKQNLPELAFTDVPTLQANAAPVDSLDFVDQCRRLLDEAEQAWLDLRPKQGLGVIRTVRKNISAAALSSERRNLLLAKVNYLEAFTAGDLREDVDVDALFIEAEALAPDELAYQERATNAYLNKEEPVVAYRLAEIILKTQPYNPYAWLVITQLEPNEVVPATVWADPAFKVGYLTREGKGKGDGTINIADYKDLFRTEIDKRIIPPTITRKTIYYWAYVAQFAVHEVTGQLRQIHSVERPQLLLNNAQLRYGVDLLGLICELVEASDLRNEKFFQVLRFEFCYCQYYLTTDKAVAQQMADELFNLFVGAKLAIALPYSSNRPAAIEAIPHRLLDLLQLLARQKDGQKMLDTINASAATNYQDDPILDLFRGNAYGLLNRREEQNEALLRYLSKTDNLDELDTINFIDPIQRLLLDGVSIVTIQQTAIDSKTAEQPVYINLLEAFLWSVEKGPKDRARACADVVRGQWPSLPDTFKPVLAIIYLRLKIWGVAKELFAQLCDENIESEYLLFYIIAIYHEREDVAHFMKLAANWREKFAPHPDLIEYELDTYRQLHNWPKVEEVATYALSHFPNSIACWWDLVRALFAQGSVKKEALLAQLASDERVFHAGFSVEAHFMMAHICFTAGLTEKGLEVAYRLLKANQDDPRIQQTYFSLSTNYQAFDKLAEPEIAEPNTVIQLRVGDRKELLELTDGAIKHNRVAGTAIGLRAGESFKLQDNTTGQIEEYHLDQIMNKYSGQIALILKKAEQPINGLPMRPMTIETNDAGEFDMQLFMKQLQRLYGPEGTKRKLRATEIRQKFASGQIGFSELCQSLFNGDPAAAWEYATSDEAGGFPIKPIYLQRAVSISNETEYVLDFTAVLCLFFLSKLKPIPLGEKRFVVSQFIIDHVTQEFEKARQERGSTISQDIQVDRVTVHFHPEDQQGRKIRFYQELLDWIGHHCLADYAPERLSRHFIDRDPEQQLFSEDQYYASSIFDSLLLATRPNRILVTDDQFLSRMEAGGTQFVSTERFLHIEHGNLQVQQLWLELVGFNFRGLTLGVDQLFKAFKSSLFENSYQKNYIRAAHSISKQYNSDPHLLLVVVLFLKEVYKEDFSTDYKRQVSQAILRRYFTGVVSVEERSIRLIHLVIDRYFSLMGSLGDLLKDDLDIVLSSL